MTISYESKAAAEQQQKEAAQHETRNREVFDEVLARYPLKSHEANFRLFVDRAGDGILSIAKCEYLLKHRVAGFNPDVVTREQLIDELAQELRDGCTTKTLSDYDFRQWRLRASTWSLRQLRQEKRAIELRRELTTAQKARNYLTEARAVEDTKYPGWPRMLKTVVPRGEIFSRDFNAGYIKSLDAFELKRLIAVYGLEQVNDRIAGRS